MEREVVGELIGLKSVEDQRLSDVVIADQAGVEEQTMSPATGYVPRNGRVGGAKYPGYLSKCRSLYSVRADLAQ